MQTIGVDAANNELYCRPEVFAQAFRYLKNFTGHYRDINTFQKRPTKSINFTFHAGEDFYGRCFGEVSAGGSIESTLCFPRERSSLAPFHGDGAATALYAKLEINDKK